MNAREWISNIQKDVHRLTGARNFLTCHPCWKDYILVDAAYLVQTSEDFLDQPCVFASFFSVAACLDK